MMYDKNFDQYPFLVIDCRVLSLSDCNYSLNPLNQTRIDYVGLDRIRSAFKLSCNLVCGNY